MAGIPLSSGFNVSAGIPLDLRTTVATIVDRDNIPTIGRYKGLLVFVESDSKYYYLKTGITNSDWVELSGFTSHTHTKADITDFSHTHTKSDITDFAHTHTKSDITDFSHTHSISDVSGLQTALDNKVNTSDVVTTATANKILKLDANAKLPASITGNADGNAATATKLATARTINGTSFDGSGNITTASWGTARTITIGSTGKTVDGSANIGWTLAEIGAAATNQTMYLGTTAVAINRGSGALSLSGVSIDGNAGTSNKLATARTLTIGSTGKAFDGSANVSWSLTEIGAASASHTHTKSQITDFAHTHIISDVTNLQTTLDSKVTHIDLPNVQTSDYKKSVIALCELTNTNPSLNSWSAGEIIFHRSNGTYTDVKLQYVISKRYNTTQPNYSGILYGMEYDKVRPCTFTYNGVKYGGIEVYLSGAYAHIVEWSGIGNFNVFGLDYYDTNTSTILNSEVYNSLNFSDPILNSNLSYNNQKVWNEGNDGSGSGLDADLLDGYHSSSFALASHTHSNYTPFASNSQTISKNTPSGAWYRIATSVSGVGRNDGIFELELSITGQQRLSFRASSMYNYDNSIQIVKLGGSKYINDSTYYIQNVRVVYYPNTYSSQYAYVEVFVANSNTTTDATLTTRLVDAIGWNLTTGAGSIPTNYAAKELSVKNYNPFYNTNDKRNVITPSSGVLNIDLRLARNETVVSNIIQNTTINISGLYDGAAGTILLYLNGTYTITLGTMTNDAGSSVTKHTSGTFSSLAAGYYIIAYRVLPDASGTWRVFISISPKYS